MGIVRVDTVPSRRARPELKRVPFDLAQNSAARSVCSPPQPNPGLPGFGHFKICRKRASPQPAGEGWGWGSLSEAMLAHDRTTPTRLASLATLPTRGRVKTEFAARADSAPTASALDKRNPHASVLLALLFDLRHAHVADLVRPMHVGAAAGLQVVPDDLDQPDAAGAHGRLDRHGFDQAGRGFEFRIRDPARAHLGAGRGSSRRVFW